MSAPNWRSMGERQLTELFRIVGAPRPKARARAQIKKGIGDLPRDLFLTLALRGAVRPSDRHWLKEVRPRDRYDPGAELGPAVDRLLSAGARAETITSIVCTMQLWLVLDLCALLDDPGELEPEIADIRWQLFLIGHNNAPDAPISGLAASLLEAGSPEPVAPNLQSEVKPSAQGAGRWRTMNEQELTGLFRKLGASHPEGWAHSQIAEGFPQLLRYLFLRQAWSNVVGLTDRTWMTGIRDEDSEGRDEFTRAIGSVFATGARPEDLTTVVRITQWHVLFSFCSLLDDILVYRREGRFVPLREPTGFRWQLFQVDQNNAPVAPIEALHESVLETDPTGREMRPAEYFQNSDAS